MKNLLLVNCFLMSLLTSGGFAQKVLPLWPGDIPNHRPSAEQEVVEIGDIKWVRNVIEPSIEIYLPTKQQATGQAMLICPGGGYGGLAYDWEGTDIAKWLNSKGIAGIVLKYRLPGSESVEVRQNAPLQDAQRAMRLIRAHAKSWNIDEQQVGVIGFSAGGHLAATLGTRFDHEDQFERDDIDTLSARPNFMALIYPVITMNEQFTHRGSRDALLGKNPAADLVEQFSNELQVQTTTPSTFLIHATDDGAVPAENSLLFYQALKDKNVSVEMHIYPEGEHGFSLAVGRGYLATWPQRLHDWLKRQYERRYTEEEK